MAAPSITVVDDADVTVSNHDFGIVQANNDSGVVTCLIWNNRGGATALSDLRDVSITSLDTDGGSSSDVVSGKWVNVNVPIMDGNETTWTQVGGITQKYLRADGLTSSSGNVIQGTVNDGNKATAASKTNYCTVRIKVHVPLNATPGTKNFKMRINGYYV